MDKRSKISGLAIVAILFVSDCPADPVYRGSDSHGRVIYSNRPGVPGEKPHSLPTVSRGDVKLNSVKRHTCHRHGGINCTKGPDIDGSVICYDGFADAENRYSLSCGQAKLSVLKIEQPGASGRLAVALRNNKGVTATSPEVTYMLDRFNRVVLTGPAEIPAYGTADFTGFVPKAVLPPDGSPVSSKHLWITCGNCG